MAMAHYKGVAGVARKVTKRYEGVSGIARRVKKAYTGVAGLARQYFRTIGIAFATGTKTTGTAVTLNEAFAGEENGAWRLWLDATSTGNVDVGRAYANVILSDYEFSGKTLNFSYVGSGRGSFANHEITYFKADGTYSSVTFGDASSATEKSFAIPDNVNRIRIECNYGHSGNGQMELIIYSLSIDDEVIL